LPHGSRVWVYLPDASDAGSTAVARGDELRISEPRIELLERLLLNEQQACAELRQLLAREQAAHQTALANLASIRDGVVLAGGAAAVIPGNAAVQSSDVRTPGKKHHHPLSWLVRAVTGMPVD
jgi:hypothetical protein